MSLKFSKNDFDQALENARTIYPETLLSHSKRLSDEYGVEILLKLENTDPIGSYKWRGAGQKIGFLDSGVEVVTASAGNHAQGVALACKKKGVRGTIFMPKTTPLIKIRKTQEIGGDAVDVKLEGNNFDEAFGAAKGLENSGDFVFVHPFDDEQTILGQSTVGLEIMDQTQKQSKVPSIIMVPTGGGGLISGIQLAVNQYSKRTKVIGVEPEKTPSMSTSLREGKVTLVTAKQTIADGANVGKVGDICFEICKENDIEILTSPEGRLCSTVLKMHEHWRTLEGAGALGVDGLQSLNEQVLEQIRKEKGSIVIVLTGGNIDTDAYQIIKERSLRYEGLKKSYLILFPEKAGSLDEFASLLPQGVSISEFHYNKNNSRSLNPANISLEVLKKGMFEEVEEKITAGGFKFQEIKETDFEIE